MSSNGIGDQDRGSVDTDLLIVGLGAMGAAVAHQAGRRGLAVVGIDRFRPPHRFGSTHAETRISRLAVGEGSHYLPPVRRSHEIWRELEAEVDRPLLYPCGGLIISAESSAEQTRWGDFVARTDAVARAAGIEFQLLDEVGARGLHPALRGLDGHRAGFEPTAGLVGCEDAVAVQLELAARDGVDLRFDEIVLEIEPDGDRVDVVTDRGRYRADRVVVAAGPWMSELLAPADREVLSVTRQVVFWFEAEDPAVFAIDAVPFVMWIGDTIEDYVAVFPSPPGMTPGVKVLGEQFSEATDPASVEREVSAAEIEAFHRQNIAPRIAGLTDRCVKAEVCLYTNTTDDHFLIDTAADSDRITIVSACSGHGFKHSAAIGEAVVERLVDGVSTIDLAPFTRDRFRTA